jgi:hypothetical protein
MIPSEDKFAEWLPRETTHFQKAINFLDGLRQSKDTLLEASGAAVSNEALEHLLKRYVDLTLDCQSEKNQLAIADELFGKWGVDELGLVRSHVNQRMKTTEAFIAAEIYEKYGSALELDEPLVRNTIQLQKAAISMDLNLLFNTADVYKSRCTNLGKDPLSGLTDAFKVALERPLSRLDTNPDEIGAIYDAAKRLDSRLVDNLRGQLTDAVRSRLEMVLDSGDVERIRTFMSAAQKLDFDALKLVQDFLPQFAGGDSVDQTAKTLSFLQAMAPGKPRARLFVELLGQKRLDESRLATMVSIDLHAEEVAEILPFLRQLPIDSDGRFTSEYVLKIASNIDQSELRTVLFETALGDRKLELKHLHVLAGAALRTNDLDLILKGLQRTDVKQIVDISGTREFINTCQSTQNDSLRSAMIEKLARSTPLSFAEIDRLVELNPGEPALAAISEAGSASIERAVQSGDEISEVRRFYEKNMDLLKLVSTPEIAQACFDDSLKNGQLAVILRHIKQLLQHETCRTAANAEKLWAFLELRVLELPDKNNRWNDELVELVKLNGQIHEQIKSKIGAAFYQLVEKSDLDDEPLLTLSGEVTRTETCQTSDIAKAIIANWALPSKLTSLQLGEARLVHPKLKLLHSHFSGDNDALAVIDPVISGFRSRLETLTESTDLTHDDLVELFEITSDSVLGNPSLQIPLATRILSVSDLSNAGQIAQDVKRYLAQVPGNFDHPAPCLQRLFRNAIREESWIAAETHINSLKSKQQISDDEAKLLAGLNEAIFAAKLGRNWLDRLIPVNGVTMHQGKLHQINLFLEITSASERQIAGTFFVKPSKPLGNIIGEISLKGLTLKFENNQANVFDRDFELEISSKAVTNDVTDISFSGLEKHAQLIQASNGISDFVIADISPEVVLFKPRYEELDEFQGDITWIADPGKMNSGQLQFFPPWFFKGIGYRSTVLTFPINDLTKNGAIEIHGEIRYHARTNYPKSHMTVKLFVDNQTSSIEELKIPMVNHPIPDNTGNIIGYHRLSITVPKGSRRLIMDPGVENVQGGDQIIFTINAMHALVPKNRSGLK